MGMGVIEWLLDSDPSIRWQVMRDLIGEPDAAVARERARVAGEGWGARLLDLQGGDGHWGGASIRRATGSGGRAPWSATAARGARSSATRRSSTVKWSRASTGGCWRSAPI